MTLGLIQMVTPVITKTIDRNGEVRTIRNCFAHSLMADNTTSSTILITDAKRIAFPFIVLSFVGFGLYLSFQV